MTARIPAFFGHAVFVRLLAAGLISLSLLLESVSGSAGATTAPVAMPDPALTSATGGTTSTPSSPTNATVDGWLVTWVNEDRVARGLRPLKTDPRLSALATDRAAGLSSLGLLSHTAVGNVGSQLSARGIQFYSWGEDLGWSSYAWGYDAARSLYTMWKHSPSHWELMMSSSFNYVGSGLGYRWSAHATYGSLVFTEARDQTGPSVRMTGAARIGTTAAFAWRGADTRLQTHTAGLRDFDLQYRVDFGPWRFIRVHTTATSIQLHARVRGHTYSVRIRARDRVGNVSGWSRALSIAIR